MIGYTQHRVQRLVYTEVSQARDQIREVWELLKPLGYQWWGRWGSYIFTATRYNKLQEYNKVGVEVSDSQGKQAISHPRGGHGSVTLTIQDNRNDRGNEARKSLEHPGCSTGAGD